MTKTILAATIAAAMLTMASGPAAAQTRLNGGSAEQDLHCMALFLAMANAADPATVQGGTVGAMYFYGRLQGRDPNTPWLDRLADFADATPLDQLNARGGECGAIMRATAQAMVAYAQRYEGDE